MIAADDTSLNVCCLLCISHWNAAYTSLSFNMFTSWRMQHRTCSSNECAREHSSTVHFRFVTIVFRQASRTEEFKALFITYHFSHFSYGGLTYNKSHCNKYKLGIQGGQYGNIGCVMAWGSLAQFGHLHYLNSHHNLHAHHFKKNKTTFLVIIKHLKNTNITKCGCLLWTQRGEKHINQPIV